ncbi:hypothetical protein BDR07DRAFT_1432987 [Suillus spraguei]|nr:hypothetical protein BDR07DRAFT_1446386 [Suillus spraguei]KAG2353554.1 hypothetical protein BDR07DRAFT_1432987 [Suillus spraguei]
MWTQPSFTVFYYSNFCPCKSLGLRLYLWSIEARMDIIPGSHFGYPSAGWCYFEVAGFIVVTYDWALTFGQEVELVWRQRWSLMTVLYLGVCSLFVAVATLC